MGGFGLDPVERVPGRERYVVVEAVAVRRCPLLAGLLGLPRRLALGLPVMLLAPGVLLED